MRLFAPAQWTRELHRQYMGAPERRKIFASLRNYLPFLNMNVLYDNSRLRQELGERFPALSPFTSYLAELLHLISGGRHAERLAKAGRG